MDLEQTSYERLSDKDLEKLQTGLSSGSKLMGEFLWLTLLQQTGPSDYVLEGGQTAD